MKYVTNYLKSVAFSLIILLGFAALGAATTPPTTDDLVNGMRCLCGTVVSLMPAICLLLIMVAGVVYAGGQVGGAETRAKAQGWATTMVIGAVIGIMLSIILPAFIKAIYGASIADDFCNSC